MAINKIVYVLSTNYAGSHFTVLQLASHSKCISAGELHRFDLQKRKAKQACHICESDETCPVFHGLRGLPLGDLHPRLFANIAEAFPNVDTLIDNSKKTAWAEKLLRMPGIEQKYLHVIRDPRALVRRWMMNYDTSSEKRKVRYIMMRRVKRHIWNIMTGSEANVYAWKWVHQNRLITDFLHEHQLDHKVYLYDELVFEPDRALSEIMRWVGHDFEPAQTEYWNFVHHGSQKPEYMKPPSSDKVRFDTRWRDYLDPQTQREIVDHPGIGEYLAEMALEFSDSGLSRIS